MSDSSQTDASGFLKQFFASGWTGMRIRFYTIAIMVAGCIVVRAHAAELPAAVVSSLASDDFKTREKGQKDLLLWAKANPAAAVGGLMATSSQTDNPEIRERCLAVLKDLAEDDFQKTGQGYVGIRMQDEVAQVPGDDAQRSVIRVGEVMEGTAGHDAGLKTNDVIVGMDDDVWRGIPASFGFSDKIRKLKPGTKVKLKLLRDQKIEEVVITLRRRPLTAEPQFLFDPKAGEAAEKFERDAHFKKWLAEMSRKQAARD